MTKTKRTLLVTAAITGLLTGGIATKCYADDTNAAGKAAKGGDAGKHDCKGKNSCKGQGGCKGSDNGCKGKNSCKGKGGCNSAHTDKDKPK